MDRRLTISGAILAIVIAACAGTGTTAPPGGSPTPDGTSGVTQPPATPAGEPVELTIESWRNDDLAIWEDQIIPAFEAQHPDIDVDFAPTPPDRVQRGAPDPSSRAAPPAT